MFTMRRCLHCLEPACVSACPTTALKRQPDGPVTYDADQCIGCRYCMGLPLGRADHGMGHAARRSTSARTAPTDADQPLPDRATGRRYRREKQAFTEKIAVPACVKACPADALVSASARRCSRRRHRIARRPDKYVDHIYGEKEAGGTSVLYLSPCPSEARLSGPRRQALPGGLETRAACGSAGRPGVRRVARPGVRLFCKRVAGGGCGRRGACADHHVSSTLPREAVDAVQLAAPALMASACCRSSRDSFSD